MADRRRWSDLSEGTRRLIIVTAVAESIIKLGARSLSATSLISRIART